jgi:hypothetical protein
MRMVALSKMSAERRCVSHGVILVSMEATATVGRGQRRHTVVVAHHHRGGELAERLDLEPVRDGNLDRVRDGLKAARRLVTSGPAQPRPVIAASTRAGHDAPGCPARWTVCCFHQDENPAPRMWGDAPASHSGVLSCRNWCRQMHQGKAAP